MLETQAHDPQTMLESNVISCYIIHYSYIWHILRYITKQLDEARLDSTNLCCAMNPTRLIEEFKFWGSRVSDVCARLEPFSAPGRATGA